MKNLINICLIAYAGMGVGGLFAQELTAAECKQVLQTYGILPASCPTSETKTVNPSPAKPPFALQAPTDEMHQNNVFFVGGGDAMTPKMLLQLEKLAAFLNSSSMDHACVKLVGHSDSSGSEAINLEIGKKRAVAVRDRLASLLEDPSKIEEVSSMGETSPIDGLPSDSAWQRRVEIWARDCG